MPNLGVVRFLRRHPVICLLLLSPGIPEYLSGSSPLNAIILNPPMFAFQILANLGLYGPGVLLVREAKVRWGKGWGSVLLLGAAYGILEEGVALSTLFNPGAGPVGALGVYGHWLGVNWVWVAGIVPVHMIYSISLPILILGLAIPETKSQRFLLGRKLLATVVILGVDVFSLFLLITLGEKFWMGTPVLVGSFAVIALLVFAGRRAKPDLLRASPGTPRASPRRMAMIGAVFYPCVLLAEFVVKGAGVAAAIDFPLVILVQALFLAYVLRVVGSRDNGKILVAFSFGLILPIAAFGIISQAALPVPLLADLVMAVFFLRLFRMMPPTGSGKEG